MKKEIISVLKKRAVSMAISPEIQKDTSDVFEVIEFVLADETYGIESVFVMEVFTLKDFTPLPGVPSFVLGIVSVRGRIISVVDMKKIFNLPSRGLGELNKVIIIHNEQMEFGILADEVKLTKEISREDLLPVPITITGIGEKYLKGITKERLILISAETLLSDNSLVINEEVTQ